MAEKIPFDTVRMALIKYERFGWICPPFFLGSLEEIKMVKMGKALVVVTLGVGLAVGCGPQGTGGECADPTDFAGQMALAKRGNAAAEYNVAVSYMSGNGVASDERKGAEWMAKAAMHGDTDAQFNLGTMYAQGIGVPKSGDDSVKWYRLAAEQGHVMAQFNLGFYLYRGEGVKRNREEAAKWFGMAAEAGDMRAQYFYGDCCYVGIGVPKDRGAAIAWYRKSAAQGGKEAQERLKELGVK